MTRSTENYTSVFTLAFQIHSTIFDISSSSQRPVSNHDSISSIGRLWWYSYCVVSFQDSYFTPISASNMCRRSPVNCH